MNSIGSDIIVYKIKNNDIYYTLEDSFLRSDLNQEDFSHELSVNLPSVPISYSMPPELYNKYKNILKKKWSFS